MTDKIFRWIPFIMLYFPFKIFSLFSSKKNVYLFGTGTGYFHDNPKYLFLEFLKEKDIDEVFWVAKTNKVYQELKMRGYPVLKRNSLIAAYYTAVAKAFIVSSELFDVAYFINSSTKLVQLWHGTPIKHIGLDNKTDKERNERKRKWLGKNYTFDRFDLLFIDEKKYIPIFTSAFGISEHKIKVFGQIRNKIWGDLNLKTKIVADLKLTSYSRIILYAPTYRENSEDNINLINNFLNKVSVDQLKEKNAILLVKLHPFLTNGAIYFPHDILDFANIINISSYVDIQELLLISDCLITDLSSSALDYSYSGKPFFSFFPDKEKYIISRDGVYLTYSYTEHRGRDINELFQDHNDLQITNKVDLVNIINTTI